MALLGMQFDEGEMQGEVITCTKGTNIGDFTFTCVKYGKIVVLSYYFTTTGGVTRDSIIATLDMPTNFVRTFFNGSSIRMHINEKKYPM